LGLAATLDPRELDLGLDAQPHPRVLGVALAIMSDPKILSLGLSATPSARPLGLVATPDS